ncbi:alkaline phosphatase [Lichtheimia corymbifera JMRC:FSU:9682]|uniref:Alkaline phosphatase n=1 Tax=Lichtheimia corymbifera JMRC:FSU:9682 TaxID=1263082 RepID=A0A068S9J8_9FUNG|nr:alkaline phosphatase [Lichtheimia corymbifera JMRC:FSU:9682]
MPVPSKHSYTAIPSEPNSEKEFQTTRRNAKLRRFLGLALLVILGTTALSALVGISKHKKKHHKRNVIMMISDGFGPASETYARQYHAWREGLEPKEARLPLDHVHVGHSRTQSSSSLVTDSAAGATAFACGLKSYNGAIGVDPEKVPCGTVLESAKVHHDMLTALVVTSRITHATPASFSAHVDWRDDENTIAEQQIGNNPLGRTVDLMFGGGSCEFLSNTTQDSCRADDRDLFTEAQEKFGWSVKRTRQEFDEIQSSVDLPLMAIFSPQHMDYEIDRNPAEQPSLKEMVEKALAILDEQSQKTGKNFFLMIEGSRIDMAAHTNDPAAHFYEIYEYHQTAETVLQFAKEHKGTVVISTSDHETGGLTVGRQVTEEYPEYKWNPEVISRVRNSSEALSRAWDAAQRKEIDALSYLRQEIIVNGLGIEDATEDEIQSLVSWKDSGKDITDLENRLSDMVSRRALIGWTTHGHTAVDVNLYAYGKGTKALRGSHENIEIGEFISNYLKLDLQDITSRLNVDQPLAAASQEELPRVSKHQLHYD